MNIDKLIDRYFEGETSAEEERALRNFFTTGPVPDHLECYIPLFTYFEEEIRKEKEPVMLPVVEGSVRKVSFFPRRALYLLSGVAAGLALLLTANWLFNDTDTRFCSGNYVVINGRCYTDINKIREAMYQTMQEVATPAEEYFPDADISTIEKEIFENQLRELGSLFSDEDDE